MDTETVIPTAQGWKTREELHAEDMRRERLRIAAIQSAAPREIPLRTALESIRYWAASEQVHARMGTGYPEDFDHEPVEYQLLHLLADVREIQSHDCDFGEDGDSLCGVCGLDPRS